MAHALDENHLPGIDGVRLERLVEAGVCSLEDVVAAGPADLARLSGFDLDTARALVRVAEGVLVRAHPDVIAFTPEGSEPTSKRLVRGLKGARDIEVVRSQVRKVESHVGKRPLKPEWRKPHRRARKQLGRLLTTLERLQRDVLSEGLSRAGLAHLRHQLGPLQAELEQALDERPKKGLFKRIRKVAKHSRHAFDTP